MKSPPTCLPSACYSAQVAPCLHTQSGDPRSLDNGSGEQPDEMRALGSSLLYRAHLLWHWSVV